MLLIVLGALFEIGDVAVVVDNVRKSKRAWRDYINRQPKVFGAGAVEMAAARIDATGHVIGSDPTPEQRLASLESRWSGSTHRSRSGSTRGWAKSTDD